MMNATATKKINNWNVARFVSPYAFDAKGKKIEGATTSVTFFSDSDEVNVARVDKDGMFISGPDRISVTGAKDWNFIVGAYEEYAAKGLFTRQIMA